MQNIDIIIGKLSQEQVRTERLLLRDLAAISVLFSSAIEEQQRQLDALRSQAQVALSAFATKIRDGYPEGFEVEGAEFDGPIPAIISGKKLSDEERKALMNAMIDKIDAQA